MRELTIGLLGCGTVGAGFLRLLSSNNALIEERAGCRLTVKHVAVRDAARERPFVHPSILTTRAEEVVRNGVDIIVELIGGAEPARSLIRESLWSGKHVVTANKRVLADDGHDLFDLAEAHRVSLQFEASVCGAVPVIRVIRDSLSATRITALRGIVNGTCNSIIDAMETGATFQSALRHAQASGFAEADPASDIDGTDAAEKLTILARLAFPGRPLRWARKEGIRGLTRREVQRATESGRSLRLVASAAIAAGGEIELTVGPQYLDRRDPLAGVTGAGNTVILTTDSAGELILHGQGAGSLPTASAVLADVISIARRH